MTKQTNESRKDEKESNHDQKYARDLSKLYILPPIILFIVIIFQNYPINNSVQLSSFIVPSVAAGISLVIGLSTRNANISERARSKAAELMKYLIENEDKGENEVKRKDCLYEQMMLFEHRFHLNQIALFLAWISLFIGFVGLFIGFSLNYGQKLNWLSSKLPILVIGFLSYSFLVTLIDIYLGSKTLSLELKNVEKLYKNQKTISGANKI
jgi:Protein of unknown function (DUF2721)